MAKRNIQKVNKRHITIVPAEPVIKHRVIPGLWIELPASLTEGQVAARIQNFKTKHQENINPRAYNPKGKESWARED
jgi:hypothetical protein